MKRALLAILLLACDDGGASPADATPTLDASSDVADTGRGDARPDAMPDGAPDMLPDSAPDLGPPTADSYCERTEDFFCDYYLRCGRMAVPDVATCHSVFREVCNAVYEPIYIRYADAGELALDLDGIAACRDHLGGVACERQLFDLDGPCRRMWRGQVPAGGECGIGIASFTCEAGSTCVLGLDFCGTCEPHADLDAACADARCGDGAACVNDVCVRRIAPGGDCAQTPCVTSATCVDDVCRGFSTVPVGERCDRANRCQYKAECVDGTCVESALLGEPCAPPVGCASGHCQLGVCTEYRRSGEVCGAPEECLESVCDGGECGSPAGACADE